MRRRHRSSFAASSPRAVPGFGQQSARSALVTLIIVVTLVLVTAASSAAFIDFTIFGPKRYDRQKGKPTVYTETFDRCNPATQAVLRITNGKSKETRIKSATISINGVEIASENEFKQQIPFFERPVTINNSNALTVVLKSGMRDDPNATNIKDQSFLIIDIVCTRGDSDDTPPAVTNPQPPDLSLLAIANPLISAQYADNAGGSGIDAASARITIDGVDVTASASITAAGVSFQPASLPEGGHTVSVSIADMAKNAATLSWKFTTDTVPPRVSITSHQNGQYLNTPTITLSGTISDPAPQNPSYSANPLAVSIHGQAAQVTGNTFSLAGFALAEGSNTITASAQDAAGNSASSSLTIYLDTVRPVVTSVEPLDQSLHKTGTPRISASYADEPGGSGIDAAKVQLMLDGVDVTASSQVTASGVTYTPAQKLAEGTHAVKVFIFDLAGNQAERSWQFTTDTIAPAAAITSHQNEQYLNAAVITLSGTIDDASASVLVNGQPAQVSGGSFSLVGISLNEGSNTISVSATDPAGNTGIAAITLMRDTLAPVIEITAPVNGSSVKTPTIIVSGTVTELNPDGLWVNGMDVLLADGGYSLANVALSEGPNTINVTARDKAGNEATASVALFLDTIAPTVTITSPASGLLTKNPQVAVSGTVSDESPQPPFDKGGQGGILVTVNNVPALVSNQTYSIPAYTLVEGQNTLVATATDRAGNSGSASVSVTLDSTPPAPPIITPLATPSPTPVITVSGTAEAGSTVKIYAAVGQAAAALIGTVSATSQGGFSLANVTLAEGTTTFTATATDTVGNISGLSAPVSVEKDTKPPVITVTSPANNSFTNQTSITVTGTVDEPVELKINGTIVTLNNLAFSHAVSLSGATNFIVISAKDLSNNSATVNLVVYLDQVPPVVVVTAPVDGLLTRTSPIAVSGTVSETNTTVTVNGNPATVTNKSFTVSTISLAEGTNTLTAAATDRAGNAGTAGVNVFLDTQAPAVQVTAPASAAAGSNVLISTSASDNRGLSLSEVRVNGVTVWSSSLNAEPSAQNSISYSASPGLAPNTALTIQAVAYDTAGNIGTAATHIQITSGPAGQGYLRGEVYDDRSGLRLSGATVDFAAADGHGLTRITTLEEGSYFTEAAADTYLLALAKPGFTTVERAVTVKPEKEALAIDARLTPVSAQQNLIDSGGGIIKVLYSVPSTQYSVRRA